MASDDEVEYDSPIIRIHKSGRIERFFGTDLVPPSIDSTTGVSSKDIVINHETGVSARLHYPTWIEGAPTKLPVVIYYHGGAFLIGSAFSSMSHNYLNRLVAQFNVIIVSIDYRLAPEHPIPAAYDDSWEALKWVASHAEGGRNAWLATHADVGRLFLVGDSAGGTIVHQMGMRASTEGLGYGVQIKGLVMIHPYFLEGKVSDEAVGPEKFKDMAKTWKIACPTTTGADDPWINPMTDGAPSLSGLGSKRVLVCVAEKDFLRAAGRSYYKKLRESGWEGEGEILETEGEGHMFHLFNPDTEKAATQTSKISSFLNRL